MPLPTPEDIPSPTQFFQSWLKEAEKSELNDPSAACLATVDVDGMPNARMVLFRIIDERGFTFFTNYNSQKGRELLNNPKAALCFHWKSLKRQVRIQGLVEKTSAEEADAYFNSRARESRVGAWASLQSQTLDKREILLDRYKEFDAKFEKGDLPRPPHWSGFRIKPVKIEFWEQADHRLHDRLVFEKDGNYWKTRKLYP